MTLVFLQSPAVAVAFGLCALFVVLAGRLSRLGGVCTVLAGVSGVFALLSALVCSVPLTELLALLVVILLLGCLPPPKEDNK